MVFGVASSCTHSLSPIVVVLCSTNNALCIRLCIINVAFKNWIQHAIALVN